MSKCRICLKKKIKLFYINDTDRGVSHASMIAYLSDVKNLKETNDMICISCRKKLRDSYEFKLLIERSDLELNRLSRVYKFNTIEEVEFLMNINKKPLSYDYNYNNIIQNGSDFVYYNNTLIKRVCKEEKTESIISETIEDENTEFSDRDISLHEEEEYYYKKKKKRLKCKEISMKGLCIRPVFLKDLRVLKTCQKKDSSKNKKRITKEREDICPYCGKIVKRLKTHILQHTGEKNFFCDHCNRGFYTKWHLEYHIKSHLNNMKFKCGLCIAIFDTKTKLVSHMTSHTDIRHFACNLCDKAFKWKRGLQRHMLIHSKDKPFKCDQCQMSFPYKYNLRHHSRVHTGERPYKCELCLQPYSYKRDFNRHCLKKHGVIVDHRPVTTMNGEVLKQEKALMKDIVLKIHGIKTDKEPLEYFKGPRGPRAFAKAVKLLESKKILIDVHS